VRGYEIHMGRTSGPDTARPLLTLDARADGAISADARIAGCYLHGLFASDEFRSAWLASLRADRTSAIGYDKSVDDTLDRLADHLEAALAIDRILEIARAH
jgi:adenosylcobyric acid synthase